jgi:hypothetical protein
MSIEGKILRRAEDNATGEGGKTKAKNEILKCKRKTRKRAKNKTKNDA